MNICFNKTEIISPLKENNNKIWVENKKKIYHLLNKRRDTRLDHPFNEHLIVVFMRHPISLFCFKPKELNNYLRCCCNFVFFYDLLVRSDMNSGDFHLTNFSFKHTKYCSVIGRLPINLTTSKIYYLNRVYNKMFLPIIFHNNLVKYSIIYGYDDTGGILWIFWWIIYLHQLSFFIYNFWPSIKFGHYVYSWKLK